MYLAHNNSELHTFLRNLKDGGETVGFVPTMGALHKGHVALMERCVEENDIAIASVFVNPAQFNESSDFDNYPIQLEEDFEILKKIGCHLMFAPQVPDIYPEGVKDSDLDLDGLEYIVEGKYRPGHFRGVANVIDRFFKLLLPTRAYFGAKDYQQVVVIQKLVNQRPYDVEVIACETVREENGLAMSSRNKLLSSEEKNEASIIYKMLHTIQKQSSELDVASLFAMGKEMIDASPLEFEYLIFIDGNDFTEVNNIDEHAHVVLCTAAYMNGVRLIDNIQIKP